MTKKPILPIDQVKEELLKCLTDKEANTTFQMGYKLPDGLDWKVARQATDLVIFIRDVECSWKMDDKIATEIRNEILGITFDNIVVDNVDELILEFVGTRLNVQQETFIINLTNSLLEYDVFDSPSRTQPPIMFVANIWGNKYDGNLCWCKSQCKYYT